MQNFIQIGWDLAVGLRGSKTCSEQKQHDQAYDDDDDDDDNNNNNNSEFI